MRVLQNSFGDLLQVLRGVVLIKSKKFRKINVDGEIYGWIVGSCKGFLIINIMPYFYDGSKLEIYVESDIARFWVDFPNVKGYNLRVIKPKDVRISILKAIEKGWVPKNKSDNRTYYLVGEDLAKK
jgi:hypothetical protein